VSGNRKPALLYALSALILLEGAAFAAATIYLGVEIFVGDPRFIGTAIAYTLTAAILSALVIVVGIFALRGKPWIRGATVCLAVLQLLVAYSIVITKEPTLGWVLAVPAVALLVLVFSPPVLRATTRSPQTDEDDRTF
jgi:peptidoglycan/LPS O-acetylase OafA/YrhL